MVRHVALGDEEVGPPLEHPKRDEIYGWVERFPGSNRNQIAEGLGLFYNHVEFHTDRLLDQKRLVERQSGNADILLFSYNHRHLWDREETRILYGRAATREVALLVFEHPNANTETLAEHRGASTSSTQRHLSLLRRAGLIESKRVGRRVVYQPLRPLNDWVSGAGEKYHEDFCGSQQNGHMSNGI